MLFRSTMQHSGTLPTGAWPNVSRTTSFISLDTKASLNSDTSPWKLIAVIGKGRNTMPLLRLPRIPITLTLIAPPPLRPPQTTSSSLMMVPITKRTRRRLRSPRTTTRPPRRRPPPSPASLERTVNFSPRNVNVASTKASAYCGAPRATW